MIKKAILLISSVLICMILGNSILFVGLKLNGLDSSFVDMSDLTTIMDSGQISHSTLKILLFINSAITFIGGALLYLFLSRVKAFEKHLSLEENVDVINLLLSLGLLLMSLPLASALGIMSMKIPFPEWMSTMDESSIETLGSLLQMDGLLDFIITFILVAVVAGFGEELVFRGIIQKELQTKFKHSWIAIILTALIFSAVHFQPVGFLTKFIIGLVLGYVYWVSKNLWYSIFLHTLNNGLPLIFLYLSKNGLNNLDQKDIETSVPWGMVFFSSIMAIYLTFALYKRFHDERETETTN